MADPVLVVEDDADLREMMEQLLHHQGFAPLTAPNGREALTLLQAGAPVRAILLDLMMPVMDGWEFRRLQMLDPKLAAIPVVVISAVDAERVQPIHPVAWLRKPLVVDQVVRVLHLLCQEPVRHT